MPERLSGPASMKTIRRTCDTMSNAGDLTQDSAIKRAEAHGIDIGRLKVMLELTPTERLEILRTLTQEGESAVARAEAYGIDVSLLKLALSWTPTQRVQRALEMADMVRELHKSGAKKHGARAYPPEATDQL